MSWKNNREVFEMADIVTLGELLIDLTEKGKDENGNSKFVAYPGGAPANVAVAASRLGAKTKFIGKVGNDAFGHFLIDVMKEQEVDVSGLYQTDEQHTTMAIVTVNEDGDREFSFYRSPGADTLLTSDEAVKALDIDEKPAIIHVGSLSLTDQPARTACYDAVRFARDNGIIVSYDPNYRKALWGSEEEAVQMMKSLLPYADILKVADEEMLLLTGSSDYDEAGRILEEQGVRLVIITLGGDGVYVRYNGMSARIPGVKTTVVDTNGAGDTFLGAMLAKLAFRKYEDREEESILDGITEEELRGYVMYANRAAALTCSRPGAIPAMPTAGELG